MNLNYSLRFNIILNNSCAFDVSINCFFKVFIENHGCKCSCHFPRCCFDNRVPTLFFLFETSSDSVPCNSAHRATIEPPRAASSHTSSHIEPHRATHHPTSNHIEPHIEPPRAKSSNFPLAWCCSAQQVLSTCVFWTIPFSKFAAKHVPNRSAQLIL